MLLSLNGDWRFRESGTRDWLNAEVPGCNYLDLMRNNIIPDPFWGTNEKGVYWVSQRDWEYQKDFVVTKDILLADQVLLRCDQLDTMCDIYINGKQIGSGANTHLLYQWDIKDNLAEGKNNIYIKFYSPVNYVKKEQKKWRCPVNSNGLTGIALIRKPQYHFGWDWGPVLTPSGISGNIGITTYSKAKITQTKISQTHTKGRVRLDIDAEVQQFANNDTGFTITLVYPDNKSQSVSGTCQNGRANAVFDIEDPQLWWTNDLSDTKQQPLYRVEVSINDGGTTLDTDQKTIGLRTIILNRERDKYGENCQFLLNGKPLFIKGTNWIPSDSFITRVDDNKLRYHIDAALYSNINMIRIWGGGYYGSDEMYDLCDRYGILIWQDFQFACQAYPFFIPDFLQNVLAEISYNTQRLRHHASLALWCGNNEIEQMTTAWIYKVKYVKWTKKFFYDILPKALYSNDCATSYIPGSPYGEDFLKKVGSENIGDSHLWEVWHGLQPMTFYRKKLTRFCSEFGFESLPDYKTIQSFAGDGPFSLESEVINAHQKCDSGNLKMVYYISTRFRLPQRFEDYVYLSQITQQECIKDATEHWRRNRGRCNGAIYWQFNDCWPVCSWSSIDYYGNYKALQYTAKHFNAPFTISIENYSASAKIWVINDTLADKACTITYQLINFDGKVISEGSAAAQSAALSANCAISLDRDTLCSVCSTRNCVLAVTLISDNKTICRKTALFAPERKIALPQASITKQVSIKDGNAVITLTSDKFARLVCVQSAANTLPFSDNYFDILPNEAMTITQPLDKDYTLEELDNSYSIQSVSGVKASETSKELRRIKWKVFSRLQTLAMIIIYKLGLK